MSKYTLPSIILDTNDISSFFHNWKDYFLHGVKKANVVKLIQLDKSRNKEDTSHILKVDSSIREKKYQILELSDALLEAKKVMANIKGHLTLINWIHLHEIPQLQLSVQEISRVIDSTLLVNPSLDNQKTEEKNKVDDINEVSGSHSGLKDQVPSQTAEDNLYLVLPNV